jgi:(E)-4-hydroxy-3-methylbut-2-enyl-diphosphate synthase
MEAVEHVEKIRVNPGNYADKKKFAVREYSDADYETELQRLHDAFSPLVKRCRELGRAMRIGTNHGSLSDRIMNRYGDTPLGMVESALEFLRIAEAHDYRALVLSMKASNPKVMIQAYRLLVQRMAQEDMHYPLHLGVTEAGDGEDGRIKSAIGIGSLLLDGLGDTLRVSLTEDSVYEVPVARALADKAQSLWARDPEAAGAPAGSDGVDPYHFTRRETSLLHLGPGLTVGPEHPPRVIVRAGEDVGATLAQFAAGQLKDTPPEIVLVRVDSAAAIARLPNPGASSYALELSPAVALAELKDRAAYLPPGTLVVREFGAGDDAALAAFAQFAHERQFVLAAALSPADVGALAATLQQVGDERFVATVSARALEEAAAAAGDHGPKFHATGVYRGLAAALRALGSRAPIWIRNTTASAIRGDNTFLSRLLDASILSGGLLCDGLGDLVSVETEPDPVRATKLAYNVLQGAGARISKTEFVACPSCGRTLFDLQTTTQRIRAQTGHLKGVKIAIMGCIVNGPGEMADADFGYVGGAPGKINLYVGKNCVQYNIPQADADAKLIALIKEHGKWFEPALA